MNGFVANVAHAYPDAGGGHPHVCQQLGRPLFAAGDISAAEWTLAALGEEVNGDL
jgi:hypothetical protein